MDKEGLRAKIYAKVDEIPTLPTVLPRLLALMEDERTGVREISEAISRDPALASKILKAANSAYYGFPQKIATLDTAVPLLGFNMVKSLALSIGVVRSLPSRGGSPHLSTEDLWVHSLAVGTLMQEMAARSGRGREYVFVLGLLHDIGKVVLDQFFGDLFQQALREAAGPGGPRLHEAERRLIGCDHGEVGAILLTRWRFPTEIRDCIEVHHRDEVPEGVDPVDVALLRVADALSQRLGLGASGNAEPPPVVAADLERAGIGEEDLGALEGRLEASREGIYALFRAIG